MTITISYPIALPTQPGIARVKFNDDDAVAVSESPFTFEQQTYVHQGQRFKAMVTLPKMKRVQAAAWVATMRSLGGRAGTFLLGDPDAKAPQGTGLGSPEVSGASQTGNNLITNGWTANKTGLLLPGDYIQLGTGAPGDSLTRMHMVLQQVNSDSGGNATLLLWPLLRYSPLSGATITLNNCKTQMRLDAAFGYDTDEVSTFNVQFSCTEAL